VKCRAGTPKIESITHLNRIHTRRASFVLVHEPVHWHMSYLPQRQVVLLKLDALTGTLWAAIRHKAICSGDVSRDQVIAVRLYRLQARLVSIHAQSALYGARRRDFIPFVRVYDMPKQRTELKSCNCGQLISRLAHEGYYRCIPACIA